MSKREDKDKAEKDEILGNQVETSADNTTDKSGPKVISRGRATLVIARNEEKGDDEAGPRALIPEPRVMVARPSIQESGDEINPEEEVLRLERDVNPGKERIKIDKAKFEERIERPDEAEIQEEQWGEGIAPGWWVAIAGGCAALILLGGLALESWWDGDQAQVIPDSPIYTPPENPHEGSPEEWFHKHAGSIHEDALALLKGFILEKNSTARSKYVRFPQAYLDKKKETSRILTPRLDHTNEHAWAISHTEDTAFLTLMCRDSEFMLFRAYFTREEGVLKLDWGATSAWCDVNLETLKANLKKRQDLVHQLKHDSEMAQKSYQAAIVSRNKTIEALRQQEIKRQKEAQAVLHVVDKGESVTVIAQRYKITVKELMVSNGLTSDLIQIGQQLKIPQKHAPPVVKAGIIVLPMPKPVPAPVFPAELYKDPILVRCTVHRKEEFYAGPYNDQEHAVFMLRSSDELHYMWAYTKRDSPLDLELRRRLDHGRFVVGLRKNLRLTLRIVRNLKDALPTQVELVEMVHPEWVTP